ncbi:hypothetical protein ACPCKV_28460 [Streptomyces koyangensis]|uniref:hypothetical protein n=1 Tax=Streptomyces koyangensis TaxID=188770 RepID=UPI003C2F7347
MNRRSSTAVSLAVAAVLSLSACGGGGGKSGEGDEIAGADGGGSTRAAPEPSASPEVERPVIKLPKDMENVFEGGATGDPVVDAVLRDNEGRITSLDEAIHTRSLERPAFGFYNTGQAARGAAVWVQGFYDDGITWTGTVRYYDRKVTVEGKQKDKALLSYCSDETKAYNKDIKTGKTSGEVDDSADSRVFYITRLVKNDKGVWQTTEVNSKRGASQCR